jgi:hypothetical protein
MSPDRRLFYRQNVLFRDDEVEFELSISMRQANVLSVEVFFQGPGNAAVVPASNYE